MNDEQLKTVEPRSVPSRGGAFVAFSGIEDERLFVELRSRLFCHDVALRIGRYRVVRRLGAGAMGEVFLAVDEQLERPIAIKLVHAHLPAPRWAEGLRAEARALARLAHPNVVRVYEVGEHEERIYLAMEYVEGRSLREWLAAQPGLRWDAILAVYLDAARGLAAAHRAGIVHRDFKPDNVLRGSDGRVAVVDFGLAALELAEGLPSVRMRTGSGGSGDQRRRTASPAEEIAGTPAYMAPEQFRGRADARADQFALCVSLYEALWGHRPFPRRTLEEVLEDHVDWKPVVPRGEVPGWVWSIIRRGLDPDPQRRFTSVDALIIAMEAQLARRRRRRWLWGSGAVTIGVGLLSGISAAGLNAGSFVDDCATVELELDDTWAQTQRERLREHFVHAGAGRGGSWLADSEAPVAVRLDRWRARWLQARGDLCRARVGGDPVVLDRLGRCLERHRQSTQAVVDAALHGDLDVLRQMPAAVQQLEDPKSCAREARQGGPPQPSAVIGEQVDAAREWLASIEADLVTGQVERARVKVESLQAQAQPLAYGPLTAEILQMSGRIALAAGRSAPGFELLERAADTAEAARHDRVVASSWRHMAMAAVTTAARPEAGRRWLRRAEAASAREGLDPRTTARLDHIRGNLSLLADDLDAAVEQLARAQLGLEREGDLLYASYACSNLGVARLERGETDEALGLFERALEQREQVFGPRHPEVARAAYDLAQAVRGSEHSASLGELATALLQRAIEIWTTSGEGMTLVAGRAAFALAQLELDAGHYEAGLAHAQDAAAAFGRTLDPERIEHAEVAALLGTGHYFLAQPRAAVDAWRRAVAGYSAAHGIDDVHTAYFRVALGWALLAAGEIAQARAELEAGRDAIEARAEAGREQSIDARLGLAAVELADGALDRATTRMVELGEPPSGELDRITYALVSGLVAMRSDPTGPEGPAALARARTLAEAVPGGAAMLEVLLDGAHANAAERGLAAP